MIFATFEISPNIRGCAALMGRFLRKIPKQFDTLYETCSDFDTLYASLEKIGVL